MEWLTKAQNASDGRPPWRSPAKSPHQGSFEIRMEGRFIRVLEEKKHEITKMADLCTKFTLSGCHRFYPEFPDHWYDLIEAPVRVPKFTPRKKHNRAYRSRHGHVIIGFQVNEDTEQLFEDDGVEEEEQLFEDNAVEPIPVNEVEGVAIDEDVPELGIEDQEEEHVEDDDVEAIILNEVAPIDGGDVPEEYTEYEGGLLAAKLGGEDGDKVGL
ncbi:uncharacterized protein [Triticum aestivum]|nr:uncharacterized protein LOC123139904 isoform X2 [Triticum aestivum]XP_044415552.1 uncharacterized protein LOC123139904 isoform X2 [Triticum aestivum]